MNQGKICVSICGKTVDEVLSRMDAAANVADVIEIRFDCLNHDQLDSAFDRLKSVEKTLLITFRPSTQGGRLALTMQERLTFWQRALRKLAGTNFLVDLEYDLQLPFPVDPSRAIVSYHNFTGVDWEFPAGFLLVAHTRKLAISVEDATDALYAWECLEAEERFNESGQKVIPIAMGEAGKWTRILGLSRNAPLTYAALDLDDATAPGQITAADLRDVFRVKELDTQTDVYAVLAGNTSYSLSPYMHNAAFKRQGRNSVFVPMQVADLDAFMRRMVKGETREVELNFRGFSVTNPHKRDVMKYLDGIDAAAEKIGAVNTIKIENGKLHGHNTDAPGFIAPLKRDLGDLRDAKVTIVGAGGASRACVFALKEEGAEVTLLARDPAKASELGDEFGIRVVQLTTDHRPLTTDILVNATPLGTRGDTQNETIATAQELREVKLVYDLVYNPSETRLIREAREAGAKTIGGLDMLIAQGAKQFEIWTGQTPPLDEMREAIEARLT